ncbi:MAG: carboxypeptidase M32 [Chloroflexi bacterium]|nr:carboxypeptidase M32 [Chloroflexota bacterium]
MTHKYEALLQDLKQRLFEIYDLNGIASLLHWDQTTYMPPAATQARARHISLISRLAHERLVDPEIGKLLDALRPYEESLPYDHDDAALIRVTRKDYERATRVPSSFLAEFLAHQARTYDVWTKARPANDFSMVAPYLEKTLEYSRQLANFFPGYEHIADPLIDFSDEGMKVSILRPLFAQLREALVPLVKAISAKTPPDDRFLYRYYPEPDQLRFGLDVIRAFGFDFERGRQDKTHHPFMIRLSLYDVRITTRVKEHDLSEAMFSTFHESGHGMYEQGINPDYEGTPLAGGTSSGVHESQSRTWENYVGRSRPFWEHFFPKLQSIFPEQLADVDVEAFYRAVNKVQPSLIRTDADEVTYNLHVIIRFELELALLEGTLSVRELPDAWRAKYREYLGVEPPDDKDGVLQDVHWYGGHIGGAFQGYTLGNIIAAQFFEKALEEHPEIPDEIRQGRFDTLHGWLREQVYQHGRKYTPRELIRRVTGQDLTLEPYLRYLRRKYGELYQLDLDNE